MINAATKPSTPPLAIWPIGHANWAYRSLKAAIKLELFEILKNGDSTSESIAANHHFDKRGVQLILEAMVSLSLVEKKGEKFGATETSNLYLAQSSPLYMGEYLCEMQEQMGKTWDSLADCVRSGRPVQEVNREEVAEKFFPRLAAAIFPMSYTTAQMIAEKLKFADLKAGSRVLDIAAGSGAWSIPIAQLNKGIKVDALDFPAVLEVAKQFTKQHGVAERFSFLSGSWQEVALTPASYDIVVLGHILHSEGLAATKELLKKVHAALKPGGRVIIAEFLENEDKCGPAFVKLFALNMYMQTSEGCVFTVGQLGELLKSAGFANVERLELPFYQKESPIVVANRQ
jgi:ubiquinone/menaquinone biosynthesis C-methylase UbiE